jgi:hypothetical protein
MKGTQIKIDGKWIYLPDDFSISLEQNSPVFNEQGTFSFPFEIPIEPNREVFKNVADPFGDINIRDVDKLPAELWVEGVMIYKGIIEVDDEVEFDGSIPVTFLSGNSDFMSRIDGMQAQEVPLDRQIKLGYMVTEAHCQFDGQDKSIPMPEHIMMNYTEFNVTNPYPFATFCNVRVCASDENVTDGSSMYVILEAKRPFSGVCFYLRYFLRCLFLYLDITVSEDNLSEMEDIDRMAFFTTKCKTTYGEELFNVPLADIMSNDFLGMSFNMYGKAKGPIGLHQDYGLHDFSFKGRYVYATNENFPSCSVDEVIEYMQNALGVRFIYESRDSSMRMYYLKDIMRDTQQKELDVEIVECKVSKSKYKGIRLTYGEEEDTAFAYTDYSSVVEYDSYAQIIDVGTAPNDRNCYIDRTTGNAYRIKVNKDTGGDPSLFEVAGFRDYLTEGAGEEAEEQKLGFLPVICNDVQKAVMEKMDQSEMTDEEFEAERRKQCLAIFADVQLNKSKDFSNSIYSGKWYMERPDSPKVTFTADITLESTCQENYDTSSSNEAPLRSYDAGLCVGIMRGPGNESGMSYFKNYDGEGNDAWMQTVADYAFTSDSCDNYGHFFDYNGTEEGGADQEGRFSLKLIAGKDGYPIGDQYKNRGLVSKFLSEYLFFMANKKTVVLTVRMTITQIAGIDFLKRYRIGDYMGFINKISYTLDVGGLKDVTIELYCI